MKKVKLALDVYRCCFHHALSSQAEEVMGILIGQVQQEGNETIIDISALRIVPRLDKRPDRVEISDEQMIKTTQIAEDLADKLDQPGLCVIGWYHSHPHITVWPSHVDLKTQFSYQRLSPDFIGLIFSCFDTASTSHKTQSFKMVAFQAQQDENLDLEQILIPVEIIDRKLSQHVGQEMVRLANVLNQENVEVADKLKINCNLLDSIKINSALDSSTVNILQYVSIPTLQQLESERLRERKFATSSAPLQRADERRLRQVPESPEGKRLREVPEFNDPKPKGPGGSSQ